ncbi:hypothetical protein EVAR_101183_1 [Eumeta japonica]|uniref:Uncharacterized protein n=1 Tax=Eumeta variegata TaxID=151549 RepID=A0A4C1SKE4_EUMVA|nr:hypothetical protein EVAR_101183_1 [Eumeta japonica]
MATLQLHHQTWLPYSIKVLSRGIKRAQTRWGWSFNYGVPMATFQLHHQTCYHIVSKFRQDESNEPKLDGVASFNYGVPMATFAPSSDADYHSIKSSSRGIKRAQTRWGCVV